ncbi:MAG: hypothetical protein RLZZ84_433 [Pseudomonadota bacterium]|jgi:hypothetical protein
MIKNIKNFSGAVALLALAALPGVAHAGTATATGTATLTVVNQCSVTGATVNLGNYLTTNTWGTVGASLGQLSGTTFTAGSRGAEYLTFGSVTCDNNVPYTLSIVGTGSSTNAVGAIKLTVNSKVMTLLHGIKKVGATTLADSNSTFAGAGQLMTNGGLVSATGTGAAQTLLGNVTISPGATGSTAALTDALTTAGTYTDALSYTLNF